MGSAGEFDIRVRILEITKVTEYVYTTQEANKAGVERISIPEHRFNPSF